MSEARQMLLAFTLAILGFFCVSYANSVADVRAAQHTKPTETIVLTKKNTAILRGQVNDKSVAKLEESLKMLSRGLKADEVIYLVIDSGGGEVEAGLNLIDFVHGLPVKVKTISIFSASMAFHIVQFLDERLALRHGKLMQHPGSLGISGPVQNVRSWFKSNEDASDRIDREVAKRLKISFEKYRDLIHDDLWLDGKQALDLNAIDRIVNVRCDATLDGTYQQSSFSFETGPVEYSWSNCPLIREPISQK